jgi:threonine synthase
MTAHAGLVSTISGKTYPLDRLEEFAENGESLEVSLPDIAHARHRSSPYLWERFGDFLPFPDMNPDRSLGEGNTPLLPAGRQLHEWTGLPNLLLKNETQNPTWSFKDRGSLTCMFLADFLGERVAATISTGNMGHSLAAYGARAGVRVIVFVPGFAPHEKVDAMAIHGATVLRVEAPDYSVMKRHVLGLAGTLGVRIVSGNGPVRVEGYKLTAFELYEQMEGRVPDYIAVPTSAGGHVRGIFKGYRELREAGWIRSIPRFIIVQARNNNPITGSLNRGEEKIVPVSKVRTIAEAITTGDPPGGEELLQKARTFGWLGEDVTEEDILESQRRLAAGGFFVEPAAATSLAAVRSLVRDRRIDADATVVLMLTGAGLKDMDVLRHHTWGAKNSSLSAVASDLRTILAERTSEPRGTVPDR